MCTEKRKVTFSKVVPLDKSTTLKQNVQQLVPCTKKTFEKLVLDKKHLMEVRSIGYIDRYYNDYGILLGVQDGITKFYVSNTLLK